MAAVEELLDVLAGPELLGAAGLLVLPVLVLPVRAVPALDAVPAELVFTDEPAGFVVVEVAACDEPGSATATTPAAATLANDTEAVTAFSLRRPRSRWATAWAMWRDLFM